MYRTGDSPTHQNIHLALRPREKLLWHGAPDIGRHFNGKDIFLIPFGLLCFGLSLRWLIIAVTGDTPVMFWIFGSAFTLLGLFLVVGRFWLKVRNKRATSYAITNQRAMILHRSGSIRDYPVQSPWTTTRLNMSGSHGAIHFSPRGGRSRADRRRSKITIWENTGMDGVFGVNSVSFSFHDVAQPEPMFEALERARG